MSFVFKDEIRDCVAALSDEFGLWEFVRLPREITRGMQRRGYRIGFSPANE